MNIGTTMDATHLFDQEHDRIILTEPQVIKVGRGRLVGLIVLSGGTDGSGSFVFNDCESIGAARAGNVLFSLPAGTELGTVIRVNFPVMIGLVLSAVPIMGQTKIELIYT